jgi:hypothetical protein
MKKTFVCVLVCIMCVFLVQLVPVVQALTDYFSDSMVLVIGKSDSVSSTALWLFGFKCILNKRVIIKASGGEGEKINAIILPPKFGFYVGHENIVIQLEHTKGLFFWGEKSFVFQQTSQRIFAVCKAGDIWITYT